MNQLNCALESKWENLTQQSSIVSMSQSISEILREFKDKKSGCLYLANRIFPVEFEELPKNLEDLAFAFNLEFWSLAVCVILNRLIKED